MKSKRYEGADLRRVLTAMITDPAVCSRVASRWSSPGLFDADWANLIGGWCVSHLRAYGQPPNGQISSIFEQWASTGGKDEKVTTAVESFLQSLSRHAEETQEPSEYILDLAGKYFNRVRLEQEITAARLELERGAVDAAHARVQQMQKVNLGVGSYIEPAAEPDLWLLASERTRHRPLFTYRGALHRFVGDSFQRGRLFAFMGPDKVGKTRWLIDAAYRAVRARCRVAYFDLGDSDSEEEVILRLAIRAAAMPEKKAKLKVPSGWEEGKLIRTERQFEELDMGDAYRTFRKICKGLDVMRVSMHPNSSLDAESMDGMLSDWEREGWRPDVVVADYADILAPMRGSRDEKEEIDKNWKRMRQMAQSRHCLVLTATQSSALAYGKEEQLLSRRHFSGRKTKLAHVNGMLGINVSAAEKETDAARINWVVRRKGVYSERRCCRVAGCLAIGNPAMVSMLG